MYLYINECPLVNNLSFVFLHGCVEGYSEWDMYVSLLNSKYNNCFKVRNVRLFYRLRYGIYNDIIVGLQKNNKGPCTIKYLIYAYAYICYKYRLTLTELEEILPIREQLDISYANKHFMEISCARHIEALYLDTIPMRWA